MHYVFILGCLNWRAQTTHGRAMMCNNFRWDRRLDRRSTQGRPPTAYRGNTETWNDAGARNARPL